MAALTFCDSRGIGCPRPNSQTLPVKTPDEYRYDGATCLKASGLLSNTKHVELLHEGFSGEEDCKAGQTQANKEVDWKR